MRSDEVVRLLATKPHLVRVANNVSKKIGRKLTTAELENLNKSMKSWATEYVEEFNKHDDDDNDIQDTITVVLTDMADSYVKIVRERNNPPKNRIDTHEMLKGQIYETNVNIHQPSGYPDLKYDDEDCLPPKGTKFGGKSGRELGLYGEQPNYDNANSTSQDSTGNGAIDSFIAQNTSIATKSISGPQSLATEELNQMKELALQTNVLTEDVKLNLDSMKKMLEFYYRRDYRDATQPAETDPKQVSFRDAYLQFDSRFRDLTFDFTDNTGSFRWAINNVPFLQVDGAVGVVFALQDIVEMELEPFLIPNDNTYLDYYQRISLFIQEINTQAVMSSENTRYHWLLQRQVVGNKLLLTPTRRKMTFIDPIQFLTQATFTFRSPYQAVPFNEDRMNCTCTPGTNPVVWTSVLPHNLNSNEPVYFTNVDTGDPAVNTEINNVNGLPIVKLSSTTFSVPVDFTTVAAAITALVFFGSKRVVIPVRFRCLSRGKKTNYFACVGEHVM